MCLFISGTLPKGVDLAAVRALKGPEGSGWLRISDSVVERQLPEGMDYFLVTGSVCDCSSAFAHRPPLKKDGAPRLPKAAARWSEAKKHRWLEQVGAIRAGREGAVDGGVVSWYEYLKRLVAIVRPVGIILHWYRGNVETEGYSVLRRSSMILSQEDASCLTGLQEDVLYLFS